jgi:hypothetical protein
VGLFVFPPMRSLFAGKPQVWIYLYPTNLPQNPGPGLFFLTQNPGRMGNEILSISSLIFLNGLLTLAESSLEFARRNRLENQAKKGSVFSKIALNLTLNPNRVRFAIQAGYALILLGIGSLVEDLLNPISSGFGTLNSDLGNWAVTWLPACWR